MTQGAIDLVQAELLCNRLQQLERDRPKRIDADANASSCEGKEVPDLGIPLAGTLSNKQPEGATRRLRMVDWTQDSNEVKILMERPFVEDVSTRTRLDVEIKDTSLRVLYSIHAPKQREKEPTVSYELKMEYLNSSIVPQDSGCYLGSGTIDEITSSVNLACGSCDVKHSDPSTVICLVLRKKEPGVAWQSLEHISQKSSATVVSLGAQGPDLVALRSFIRKTRKDR